MNKLRMDEGPRKKKEPIPSKYRAEGNGRRRFDGCRKSFLFLLGIFFFLPVWIFREPAFFHSLLLLEKLPDAPQQGKTEHRKQRRKDAAFRQNRQEDAERPRSQKKRPDLSAEIIFRLDYDRMQDSDQKKRAEPNDDSGKIRGLPGKNFHAFSPLKSDDRLYYTPWFHSFPSIFFALPEAFIISDSVFLCRRGRQLLPPNH